MEHSGFACRASKDEGSNERQGASGKWQRLWTRRKPAICTDGDQDTQSGTWENEDEYGRAAERPLWAATRMWKAKQQAKKHTKLDFGVEEDQELHPFQWKSGWEWKWRWNAETQPSQWQNEWQKKTIRRLIFLNYKHSTLPVIK